MEAEVRSGTSSVEVSVNAKGEPSFKVKVYEGTTQQDADACAEVAVSTMAKLRAGAFGPV